jgi:hypothetical protein
MDMKMKNAILAGCVLIFVFAVTPLFSKPAVDPEQSEAIQEARRIKEEISLLNLLNGLYLSRGQLEKLVPLAEKASAMKQQYAEEFNGQSKEYFRDLTSLRDALYNTTGPTREQNEKAVKADHKYAKGPQEQFAEEIGKIEQEAVAIFSDAQLAVIKDFKPCLIPPKNLRDPIAVGQASTTEKEEKILDIIRRMPDDLYEKNKQDIADRVIRITEKEKGKMPDDVRKDMVSTYIRKMDDVRARNAVDFDLKKKETAESFRMFDDDVTYHNGKRVNGNVARYFLNPTAAETLKKYREARLNDPDSTRMEEARLGSENKPTRNDPEAVNIALDQYSRSVLQLYRERKNSPQLSFEEKRKIERILDNPSRASSREQRFQNLERIASHLNKIRLTKNSSSSMLAKVKYLALEKNVPTPERLGSPEILNDPTGLGEMVAAAREDIKSGQIEKAYASLNEVAEHLKAFQD